MSPALWVIPWPYQRFPPEQSSLPAPSRAVHPPTRAAPFVLHRPVTNKQLDPPCHIHTSSEMPCKTACISLPPLETTPFAPSSPTGPSAEIEPDNGDWTSSGYVASIDRGPRRVLKDGMRFLELQTILQLRTMQQSFIRLHIRDLKKESLDLVTSSGFFRPSRPHPRLVQCAVWKRSTKRSRISKEVYQLCPARSRRRLHRSSAPTRQSPDSHRELDALANRERENGSRNGDLYARCHLLFSTT